MDNGHGVVKSVFFSFNQLVPTSIKTNTPSDHKTTTAWPRPHCSVPIFSSSARLVHSFIFMYFFLIYCMLFKVMCAQKNDIKERFSTKNMMLAGIACFFAYTSISEMKRVQVQLHKFRWDWVIHVAVVTANTKMMYFDVWFSLLAVRGEADGNEQLSVSGFVKKKWHRWRSCFRTREVRLTVVSFTLSFNTKAIYKLCLLVEMQYDETGRA